MSISLAIEPCAYASEQRDAPESSAEGAWRRADAPRVGLLLFGTGVVGGSLLKMLGTPAALTLQLVGVANSRRQRCAPAGLDHWSVPELLDDPGDPRDDSALLAALDASGAPVKVVVDATASTSVAACHAQWLARGFQVVTANKTLAGGDLAGWQTLQQALGNGRSYGDSAIVGAGLPVLSTLRRLRRCGDQLLAVEGVFSGSLSWLFNHYHGSAPFSTLLREARQLGYAEPDPRSDLSGSDVCRKLVIIARAVGFALEPGAVQVESLVPAALRGVEAGAFMTRLQELDAPMAARRAKASARGCVLRFLAHLDERGHARAGLVAVAPTHFAAQLSGADNVFAITTTRYRTQPLIIRGPGAGAEVTAQALLADVLSLA